MADYAGISVDGIKSELCYKAIAAGNDGRWQRR